MPGSASSSCVNCVITFETFSCSDDVITSYSASDIVVPLDSTIDRSTGLVAISVASVIHVDDVCTPTDTTAGRNTSTTDVVSAADSVVWGTGASVSAGLGSFLSLVLVAGDTGKVSGGAVSR